MGSRTAAGRIDTHHKFPQTRPKIDGEGLRLVSAFIPKDGSRCGDMQRQCSGQRESLGALSIPSYCTHTKSRMSSPSTIIRRQWRSPSDILSILLLIGGDIIQKALAQVSGYYFTPVAFSFGWIAYAFAALMSSFGDGKLMPETDCPSLVVSTQSGYTRDNKSWVLGRLLRDLESTHVEGRRGSPLWIRVYDACNPDYRSRTVRRWVRDPILLTGVMVMIIQLAISIIPWILHNDWSTSLVTAAGTSLALIHGALPQWRKEEWACRRRNKLVSLTRGNGGRLIVVIKGCENGFNLEDLATGRVTVVKGTRESLAVLAVVWLALLITVAGITKDTWYLMAIGLPGMMQNVTAAGASRTPGQAGIPLEFVEEFGEKKVMGSLQKCEERYPGVGASLLPIFFPGELRPNELEWWDAARTAFSRLERRAW